MFESGREIYRFVTLRTHRRASLLAEPECKQLFLTQLSQTRKRFHLAVAGYVLLDDHAHLLFVIPEGSECAAVVNDLRAGFLRVWRTARPREEDTPFWEHRLEVREVDRPGELRAYLDFIHYDPVRHGLVERAADYPWSSLPARIAQGVLPEDWARAGPPAGIARVLRE